MHVDGFRFDLASALARDEDGRPMHNPPLLWGIELSDALAHTKIIAEAWDAAGLYQVGTFPGYRWMEWNGRYRDSIRRFVRGDPGITGEVASRIAGSSDLYQANLRLPINSINFVTCHDGFTLRDLVTYERKHNEANGESNRDGTNDNLSWNCGVEGETDDPQIRALRLRQTKNLVSILLLSQGVPMLLAGDEVLRTQRGNNNAWCQANEIGWFDWNLVESHAEMLRFVAGLIALRKRHPSVRRRRFLSGRPKNNRSLPDIAWHGAELGKPRWDDPKCQVLAFTLARMSDSETDIHVLLNMSAEPRSFALPELRGRSWHLAVDTAQSAPADLVRPVDQKPVKEQTYRAGGRSVVVFEGR